MIYASSGNGYKSKADVNDKILPSFDAGGVQVGWGVVNGDTEAIELYDMNGQMQSSTSRNGLKTVFTYSDSSTPAAIAPTSGMLIAVTDGFGNQLNFTYGNNGLIETMKDPAGGLYFYAYDSNANLISVTYPDGKMRRYVYNESANTSGANLPLALTGIVDENNVRYATFKYSTNFEALSTEHAGGAGKYTLTYPNSLKSYVTDPLGTTRAYNFVKVLGVVKSSGITQPAPTTDYVSTSLSYDANGNVASVTDFNGNRTTYTYDLARNLELTRTEAAGTTYARTITTVWHSAWRLPVQIAEPKRITAFTYDAGGNVLTRSVQATTDATGASGVNATRVGSAQVWTYTYDQQGQVLTAKSPRTDVNDVTSYSYDASGNLTSITNSAGHVTTLSNYDPNGRVGTITDPNGLVTSLTYTPRGWLSSRTVGEQNTSYSYDDAGQLKLVSMPDLSTISYAYDGAHRLVNVADSLGNSITYTLDAMGNRTSELVKDPGGSLARKTTRVFDALNNVKQQTGGLQ